MLALSFSVTIGFAGDYSGKELTLNDKEPSLVKFTLDTRIRYEYGDQDLLDESNAATIRNRLGLLTREINGFQAFVEYEGTLAADRSEYFVPGTQGTPGKTVIADPKSHELNQAWLSYNSPDNVWGLKVGRQGINLDNQRWIGTVGWRQNMQTFDAAGFTWNPTNDLEVYAGFIWQVNRIFGSEASGPPFGVTDFKGNSYIGNAKYKGLSFGTLTSYVYSLDLHNVAGDANSNDTFGFSLAGDFIADSSYYLEYAHQVDGSSSPLNYSANYAHASLIKEVVPGIKATVGYEYLGSDNGVGFKSPLATLHKFNGFADRFLATPATGLTDAYASIGTKIADVNLLAAYHYFWDDGLDISFGQEIDLVASKAIYENVTVLAKGAFFMGQGAQPDVTRASIELNIKY